MSFMIGTLLDPLQFSSPKRRLTMEEMVNKFIEEGRREHEKIDAFIREFKTTNELLLKERNNSLSELRFEVYGLTRAFEKAHSVNYEIKGVTTRGGKTTIETTQDTNITSKPPTPYHDEPVTPIEVPSDSEPKKTIEKDARPKVLEEACTVTMNEKCSAVLLNKLPLKEKDPRSFTIPCDVGNLHIDNVLADLGASKNLMPYSMYEKLGLEKHINQANFEERGEQSNYEKSIRRIEIKDMAYPGSQGMQNFENTRNEHLCFASASKIDEKKPKLKDLPSHLEYAYLNGDRACLIIVSSKLTEK
ncbi:retrovirus-related pol polyprotein from transposon TNT 1-94 [Tanacetum coccineum]|uniref:Retrovirus-related pol polyprotein from transposon TNT 1-94 n=1 Tax=Tanacetum coccineum TaxID=301880 RepID=A0ABQ4YSN3_9ASTR